MLCNILNYSTKIFIKHFFQIAGYGHAAGVKMRRGQVFGVRP